MSNDQLRCAYCTGTMASHQEGCTWNLHKPGGVTEAQLEAFARATFAGAYDKQGMPEGWDFEAELDSLLFDLRATLLKKNRDYGNSALSRSPAAPWIKPSDALLVRIGDKISRIATLRMNGGQPEVDESMQDTSLDLAGYALLHCLARALESGVVDW